MAQTITEKVVQAHAVDLDPEHEVRAGRREQSDQASGEKHRNMVTFDKCVSIDTVDDQFGDGECANGPSEYLAEMLFDQVMPQVFIQEVVGYGRNNG